ncbi:Na+/H+ antiporter subunit A [Alkalicoccobacillus murimartini]|uniref:Multicomponent Na+:H+ antiporter subunit A n=1 Tax=Alkalicoccobacillus murimartini TaxID=171685 RepID=A0ABT9YJM3_9BACI|nr:Na+/H+ antiporter subunit A [Alkalicoccobacillus murimartini]MDQ0207808.1 multicomponent Na+:H+ antiporter subunit A [Alkalicoccobacillus murimartini]
MSWLNFAIFLPILYAIFIPFFYKKVPTIHTGWFVFPIPLVLFIYLTTSIPGIANGETFMHTVSWIPSLGINFTTYLDGLSLILALLITGVGTLVIFYSVFYLSMKREALHNFYIYLLLFMGAMLGVVLSDNLMVLYLFWELTSVSSFLLIAFWYQRDKSRYGAQKSMLITVFGGISMLAGFIMLQSMTGTWSVREIIGQAGTLSDSSLFIPAMLLVLLGAFTKSAQFPFHIWLPDAMEAPTPVSAYLHSATMVKAGIYLVARFTPVFGGDATWFWVVSSVGLITLFWGSFTAVRQTDLKALLAYSTISQLGMIMSMLGIGSAALYFTEGGDNFEMYSVAVLAALFHLINHSTFKGALFMVVGIVDHETGTRDIRKLGGLMTIMPITFTFAAIGSFAMAGLPPFNGFISKEMFFTAVLNASELGIFNMQTLGVLFPVVAWVASVFTFVYCMILVFRTFTGKYKPEKLEKSAHEAPLGMLIPPGILVSFVVVIFFFPQTLADYILNPAVQAVIPLENGSYYTSIYAWHGWELELYMTIGVVVLGGLLFLYLKKWEGVYSLFPKEWSFNTVYNGILSGSEKGADKITGTYMTGYLRHYLVYIFMFMIVAIGGTIFVTNGFVIDMSNDAPVNAYEMILLGIIAVAAVSIIFAKSRLTAIILNGVLGYMIAIFFVIFRAPDLALTQLVIETVSAALFLLCFFFLPEWKKENSTNKVKGFNLVISIGVGTVITLVTLSIQGNRFFDSISSYFEDAYDLAGGKNIVNAILADFRSFDTMLEILVLCIAGLGVYTLVKLKSSEGDDEREGE